VPSKSSEHRQRRQKRLDATDYIYDEVRLLRKALVESDKVHQQDYLTVLQAIARTQEEIKEFRRQVLRALALVAKMLIDRVELSADEKEALDRDTRLHTKSPHLPPLPHER
jgi:hypothetical protein